MKAKFINRFRDEYESLCANHNIQPTEKGFRYQLYLLKSIMTSEIVFDEFPEAVAYQMAVETIDDMDYNEKLHLDREDGNIYDEHDPVIYGIAYPKFIMEHPEYRTMWDEVKRDIYSDPDLGVFMVSGMYDGSAVSLPRVSNAIYRILTNAMAEVGDLSYIKAEPDYLHGKLLSEVLDQLENQIEQGKFKAGSLYGKKVGE